ncbi:integrase, partial [Escherichia coli]
MRSRTLPYTFQRNGNYYLQIRLSDGRIYKKSLFTDSYREASALMIGLTPYIPFVKSLATPLPQFNKFVSNLIASSRNVMIPLPFPQQLNNISKEVLQLQPPAKPEKVLTLADAWAMYKEERGRNWTKSISMANERYMEVLLVV